RYVNHIGLDVNQSGVNVFSNRGTSGIDGCTSTAVGHSLASDILNILITGDLAFFYDRNAFWHNYPLPNLIVVVLNNHGGIIFNLIDGPAGLPEADEFFITRQSLTAKSLATEFGFEYVSAEAGNIPAVLKSSGKTKIIEYDSTQSLNKEIFQKFKEQIKQVYETKLSVGAR
ncbi:MAG: 2-succinyl-5-enolpyruvyl-6-hydroxy-3-cyclohexene-1-carboxylic-acid synthase, partial [Cyclobacteriaceae bacterium]|nr:2-succinyl-5-enolpyruvyl-6-hydroxy-3-cyclohexene-1-carboxylic-acid synthase [Cyclobacteriaceae bacterium]